MSFTVYKSSAGSGKTFTLVKEYLKLALSGEKSSGERFRKILAITFTNKAAAEMKLRILSALKQISEEDKRSENLVKAIIDETSIKPENIQERAAKTLESILHNYSDFVIGTIDSFVHRIVRTFAFDLKIPVNFEIETDSGKLLSRVIDILLSRVGNDETLTRMLVEFTENKAGDEKSWRIEQDLQNFASTLLKEDSIKFIKKIEGLKLEDFLEINRKLKIEIRQFEKEIKDLAIYSCSLINSKNLLSTAFYYGDKGIGAYFKNLTDGRFDKLLPNTYVINTIEKDTWFGGKSTSSEKEAINVIKNDLHENYLKIQNIIKTGYSEYLLFKLISSNIYSLGLLNEIESAMLQYKSQNNILFISEFSKIISDVVMSQPVPFIYERLGEKYHNYLVDEFQDTSVLQWHNLLPLIDNSLSEDHFTMLVGDGKQAIYRWRGGDVKQFTSLPEIYPPTENEFLIERQDSLRRSYADKKLNTNYRSRKEIVEFNNSFFRELSTQLDESQHQIYESLEQASLNSNQGGYVSIEFLPKTNGDRASTYHEKINDRIKELLEDSFSYSDIAIITRKNSDANEVASFLTSLSIPVISSESLLLKTSSEVNFLIALLTFLNNPEDNISKAVILEYLCIRNKIEYTLQESIYETIASDLPHKLENFLRSNGFQLHLSELLKLPLFELSESLVKIFHLNNENDVYVQSLLNEILSWSEKSGNNISAFLEYWEEDNYQPSVIIPSGINAVTIISVHKSKGLEYPAVIFPFADWNIYANRDKLWINVNNEKIPSLKSALVSPSKELEETETGKIFKTEKHKIFLDNLNVLYVALTRPETRLYIITTETGELTENIRCISELFRLYLQKKDLWQSGRMNYEFGEKEKFQKKGHKDLMSLYSIENFETHEWRSRVRIKSSAEMLWNTEEMEEKKQKGILIHTILSRITDSENLKEVISEVQNEGLINVTEALEINSFLSGLLSKPGIKKFFRKEDQVKREAELLLPDGNIYRPDRVILKDTSAVVIDFKTGKTNKDYVLQLNKYSDALLGMGYLKVEKYIIYTEEGQVEEVA